jgi:phosphopantetheinyl transferase
MKKLMIKKWTQVTETGVIPPLGEELVKHIERYHGTVKHASCSAWNLLFQTMQENGLPVSTVSFTDNGKPYFADSTIHFSLSHSHDLCAVTITDQPVGIDVEMVAER